jgi:hypothetical protein
MVNDYAEHIRKFDAGSQGGNPSLIKQPDNQEGNLSEKKQNPNPPVAPRGGRARSPGNGGGKKDSRNAAVNLLREEFANAEASHPPASSATVVPLTRRLVGHHHEP